MLYPVELRDQRLFVAIRIPEALSLGLSRRTLQHQGVSLSPQESERTVRVHGPASGPEDTIFECSGIGDVDDLEPRPVRILLSPDEPDDVVVADLPCLQRADVSPLTA